MTGFWVFLGVYVVGVLVSLWMNMQLPVTSELGLLRSFLWPLWIIGWIPEDNEPMD